MGRHVRNLGELYRDSGEEQQARDALTEAAGGEAASSDRHGEGAARRTCAPGDQAACGCPDDTEQAAGAIRVLAINVTSPNCARPSSRRSGRFMSSA